MQHPAILQDAVTDVLLRVNLESVGQTIEFDRIACHWHCYCIHCDNCGKRRTAQTVILSESRNFSMANEEHLRILREGVDRWNQLRKDNPRLEPDLSFADLSHTNLSHADLSNADLRFANLSHANLLFSNLLFADLRFANLSHANLLFADLSNADLSHANLSHANLLFADLSKVNLWRTQALDASFSHADLTGACTEDWHINSATRLDEVICKYVFLKKRQQERRPRDHTKIFAPGDFAKLVQKSIETVDLIFSNGIDWQAFAISLEDLRVQYGEQDLSIQAIENENDAFVIRLNVPPNADKGAIERQAMELYETRLAD